MKILNKSIFEYTISIIIFVLLLIILTIFITFKVIQNNIHNTYNEDNFMIDIEPKISKKLDKLSDIEGLNIKGNSINITNNDNISRKYQILLSPINSDESDIRVLIDNYLIRDLSYYKKDNNSYVIYEKELEPGTSYIHQIKMWQNKNSKLNNINVNFKLSIKIIKDSDNNEK